MDSSKDYEKGILQTGDDTASKGRSSEVTKETEGKARSEVSSGRQETGGSKSPGQSLPQVFQTLKLRDSIEILKREIPGDPLAEFNERVGPYPRSAGRPSNNYTHIKASSSYEALPKETDIAGLKKKFLGRPQPKEKDIPDDLWDKQGTLMMSRLPLPWLELNWAIGFLRSEFTNPLVESTSKRSADQNPYTASTRRVIIQVRSVPHDKRKVRVTISESELFWNFGFRIESVRAWMKPYSPVCWDHHLVSRDPAVWAYGVQLAHPNMVEKAIFSLNGAEVLLDGKIIRYGPGDKPNTNIHGSNQAALIAAARYNVTQSLSNIDQTILAYTGNVTPSPQANSISHTENHGKVYIGGGKFIDQNSVDLIAKKNIQPVLDGINEQAQEQKRRLSNLNMQKSKDVTKPSSSFSNLFKRISGK